MGISGTQHTEQVGVLLGTSWSWQCETAVGGQDLDHSPFGVGTQAPPPQLCGIAGTMQESRGLNPSPGPAV